jgi:hypothetical protein
MKKGKIKNKNEAAFQTSTTMMAVFWVVAPSSYSPP